MSALQNTIRSATQEAVGLREHRLQIDRTGLK